MFNYHKITYRRDYKINLLLISIAILLFFPVAVKANVDPVKDELIADFSTYVTVNKDNSVNVVEWIDYSTGNLSRHGIYRDIYLNSASGRKMEILDLSVKDQNETPYKFTVENIGNYERLKIGDSSVSFSGKKTYVISYKATNAVGQFDKFDEIYWNTTGNNWNIPILLAHAWVTLPKGTELVQDFCYFGPEGSNKKCPNGELDNTRLDSNNYVKNTGDKTYVFNSPSILNPNEGLTVAVGFTKGIVAPYTQSSNSKVFSITPVTLTVGVLILVLILIFSFVGWFKSRIDKKFSKEEDFSNVDDKRGDSL